VIVDPRGIPSSAMYQFLIGVIVPRPIAFVSTITPEGRHNAAPFSFFMGLSSAPPLLGISINLRGGEPKDTLVNIRASREFVVNVVNEDLAARMVQTSGEWPENVDELALTGLTPIPSERVKPPRIAESPIHLECRLEREIDLGRTVFVIGEVLLAHASDEVLTDGRVDVLKLRPLGRLGGDSYSVVRDVIHFPRPRVERGAAGGG
jgi:flavin reductase (DIM6/NTAB) family NADH-FMN oxidoreductase RutF